MRGARPAALVKAILDARDAACSQLYLGGPNDKTYNLKTGSRESVEKGIAEQIRLNSGRAVSSIYCGG